MYKGEVGAGFGWLAATVIGYFMYIVPGLILHIVCVVNAATSKGNTTPITMRLMLPLLSLLLAGCATMSDVRPGDGHAITIEQRSYDDIWAAAMKVAGEHFEIRENDKATGIIRAERGFHYGSYGEWIGIFITPPASGAPRYRLEVVKRRKFKAQIGEWVNWEHKVTRDIEDVLAGRAMR